MGKTLYVAITFHGYGHIAQTAPVIGALHARMPELKVVLECAAPRELLERHFAVPFVHVEAATDFGMVMHDSLAVDAPASHARFQRQLGAWDRELQNAIERIRAQAPAMILANVPYLPLIAATRLKIPAVAYCSLNWADTYRAFCAGMPGAAEIYERILQAYRSASMFIAPEPSMPMPRVGTVVEVGPVARIGKPCRAHLDAALGTKRGDRIVAVFMGGVPTEIPLENWPRIDGVHWLIGGSACPARADMRAIAGLGSPYLDIVSACDALITKPGYGGFVEAACNGVPVLYVPRDEWPEARYLVSWLETHGRAIELPRASMLGGEVMPFLQKLWSLPPGTPVSPSGIAQAANLLEQRLRDI